ncbi:MAG: hypothetical protein AAGA99_25105 [Actinomycetota bacterium]
MSRLVALGTAPPGSEWFRALGRWAATGEVPVELARCVGVDELRRRLDERPWSVVLVDTACPGLDRDLVVVAGELGVPIIGVRSPGGPDGPAGLVTVLDADVDPGDLTDAVLSVARSIPSIAEVPAPPSLTNEPVAGRLIGVTGPGGTGTSVVAMAISQGLGDARRPDDVLLADLALHADLGMLHAATDVVPGVQELVEAHQIGRPAPTALDELTWASDDRGYRLLLGLRRHRDWTVLRPRAFAAALDSVLDRHRLVVADVDADVEGVEATGSADVADRNLLARSVAGRADLIVVVGLDDLHGVHALARTIGELCEHGVEPTRLLPVVNRAPRSRRRRAAVAQALGDLVSARRGRTDAVPSPVFVGPSRSLETALVDPARLPDAFASSVVDAARARLDALAPRSGDDAGPTLIAPGELGIAS